MTRLYSHTHTNRTANASRNPKRTAVGCSLASGYDCTLARPNVLFANYTNHLLNASYSVTLCIRTRCNQLFVQLLCLAIKFGAVPSIVKPFPSRCWKGGQISVSLKRRCGYMGQERVAHRLCFFYRIRRKGKYYDSRVNQQFFS